MDDLKYWLGLSAFPGIGPVRFGLLRNYFRTVEAIWHAPEKKLFEVNVPKNLVIDFCAFRKTFDDTSYIERLKKEHIGVLTIDDIRYPKLLKEIADPPFILYVKGRKNDQPIDMKKTIAIIAILALAAMISRG